MQKPSRASNPGMSGFSLIELLIVVSMTVFLSVGVFAVFSQGLKVWKRAMAVKPAVDVDIVFEKLSSDIRNALSGEKAEFKGGRNGMSFWSIKGEALIGDEASIGRAKYIHYEFDPARKRLMKSEETLQNRLSPKYSSDNQAFRQIADTIKDCSFEYYHENTEKRLYQWKSFWNYKCTPKAIRVSLKYDDEYSVVNYTKVVSLPAQTVCKAG